MAQPPPPTVDVVDDAVGHRGEDRLDVTVVLGPQLRVEEPIEFGLSVAHAVLEGLHALHDGPRR